MRFVTAAAGPNLNVQINAPFSLTPGAGMGDCISTVSYRHGTELASVSLFDRWAPRRRWWCRG